MLFCEGGFMRKAYFKRTLITAMSVVMTTAMMPMSAFAGCVENPSVAEEVSEQGDDTYSLVWSEEFDGDGLNTSDWNVEEHEKGWVNRELQRYTSLDEGNIEVSDGVLKIKPHINNEEATEGNEEVAEPVVTEISFSTGAVGKDTSSNVVLQINFGKINDSEAGVAPAQVSVYDVSLTDDEGNQLLRDLSFENGINDWPLGVSELGSGSVVYSDGKAHITIESSGENNYNVQLQQFGLTLENGKNYNFSMKAVSDVDRMVEIGLLDNTNWDYYGGTVKEITGSGVAVSGSGTAAGAAGEITSGRITTQGKHDFTYGRFEARAKVPAGQGYLPAFWLMASDEGLYGQWPRCGEIDIMEVMGQNTSKSYHTIHYGYNSGTGHKENQGSKVLDGSDFADEYHVFTVDWDPGMITWYVDGEQVYSTNDWYTGTDDDNQVTYPAPFDQNFYIILNLAVGGSWVGYPGEEEYAQMNDKSYEVDYVRVYQKSAEEYERLENEVKKPEKEPVTYREADETGNYVVNGDFGSDISDKDWVLHLESDADGSSYEVKENAITITPSAVGSQNHSVQLKQENIPMYKGWEYELTFDAVAAEERNIVIDVEGPDRGWTRYMQDTTVAVGTTLQSFTYSFTMNEKTDANSSLEFNLGNQGSTAPVTISNVRLVHKSGELIPEDTSKTIRPDGNYIYNGSFDQGEKRLGYWEFSEEDAQYISVTNSGNKRELKVTVPEGKTVTVKQSNLSPLGAEVYSLDFTARTQDGASDGIEFNVAGNKYTPQLEENNGSFSRKISVEEAKTREESYIEILFVKPGTYYVDNVFLGEAALIKNGSFNAGLAGYTPYLNEAATASYVVDSMNGNDNTFAMNISDTGDTDWYVQLNQDGVTLEQGKTYFFSLRMKSSITRNVSYMLQQNGDKWYNYSNTGIVEIGPEWQTFSSTFTMEYPTDTATRFNVTMGAVGGERITQQHDVYVDDIVLYEVSGDAGQDDPEDPTPEDPTPEDPTPVDPTPEDPTPDDPTPVDPTPEDPTPEDPTPEDPTPEDPTPEDPTPENPDPEDDPAPVDPGEVIPPAPAQTVVVVRAVVRTVVKVTRTIIRSIFGWFR